MSDIATMTRQERMAAADDGRLAERLNVKEAYQGTEFEPDALEHTLDGYIELITDLRETSRAVSADFHSLITHDRKLLEQWAAPHIEAMNEQRSAQDQIDIHAVNERFLAGLAEPAWHSKMPTDPNDEEQMAIWTELVSQFDELMQENLEALYELHTKVAILDTDEKLMTAFAEAQHEKVLAIKTASALRKNQQQKQRLHDEIVRRRMEVIRKGRPLTKREAAKITALKERHDTFPEVDIDPDVSEEELMREYDRLMRRDDRQQFEQGLLLTDQMQQIIEQAAWSMLRGDPVLLVGETGGAKTALAEYLAQVSAGKEPEFVSGYGDANSYQLMGKSELTADKARVNWSDIEAELHDRGIAWDNLSDETKAQLALAGFQLAHLPGSTESIYVPGPIIRAMESGRPVILDEINAMPAELLKRLNKIMQLRPGDTFTIQEDSGREVVVQPGFCIIATANEKSKRYKGVDDLSVEFQNRFGANIYRVRYPDHDTDAEKGEPAVENDRLAVAAVANRRGELPASIDEEDFDMFVRACRLSQQMFAGKFGTDSAIKADNTALDNQVLKNRLADGKPVLEETVLAPRTMVDILRVVVGSHGEISIKRACENFLDGIKNQDDREVLRAVLQHHNLLQVEVQEAAAENTVA